MFGERELEYENRIPPENQYGDDDLGRTHGLEFYGRPLDSSQLPARR